MGRKAIDEKHKSKMRPVSLKNNEVDFIKQVGKGSLTAGVRKMQEITELVLEVDGNLEKAKRKITGLIDPAA